MSSTYNNVNVAATATKIVAANKHRVEVRVKNNSAVVVYLGSNSSVTTSNGYPLASGDEWEEYHDASWGDRDGTFYTGDIFGIVAAGTADTRYWERDDTGSI